MINFDNVTDIFCAVDEFCNNFHQTTQDFQLILKRVTNNLSDRKIFLHLHA